MEAISTQGLPLYFIPIYLRKRVGKTPKSIIVMKSFKFIVLTVFCIFTNLKSHAQEERNVLVTDINTMKFLNSVIQHDNSWIQYPSYVDRESWAKVPAGIRSATIEAGEKFLGYTWPTFTATMYLEFIRTGNRAAIDQPNSERRNALSSLAMAELMEGEGRFLDDLVNGVFSISEQTYWGSSAHFYIYGFDNVSESGSINQPSTVLPDNDNKIIDLFVAELAADLAWIYHFFNEEFDRISPVISKRLKSELKQKVLDPYYERNDYWWVTGWGPGDRIWEVSKWTMNNWTPWITYNLLNVILLIEDDPQRKQNGVFKTMASINHFINMYAQDGACDEGPGYWRHAAGKMYDYLDLLKRNTNGKIDIFGHEVIKNMGRYIYRAYIGKSEHYINFSSAAPRIRHNGGHIFRFGRAIDDRMMMEFGAFLLKEAKFGEKAVTGGIGENMENLFNLDDWQQIKSSEPLLAEFYFADSEIALARDRGGSTDGFYFAAWGGDNGGGHNHNDNGSCILYYNGYPVLMDVGRRGTETAMHNLPLINGFEQPRGAQYKANNSGFSSSKEKASFSTDISGSYPPEARAKKWIRSYTLERGKKFVVQDAYQLDQNTGNTKLHFLTDLPCRVLNPGILELSGDSFSLHMKFNPSILSVSVENSILGDEIARIVFHLKSTNLSGNVLIEVMEAKNPATLTKQ